MNTETGWELIALAGEVLFALLLCLMVIRMAGL